MIELEVLTRVVIEHVTFRMGIRSPIHSAIPFGGRVGSWCIWPVERLPWEDEAVTYREISLTLTADPDCVHRTWLSGVDWEVQ